MSNISIELYHLKGCPPCGRFMPEWVELKKMFKNKSKSFSDEVVGEYNKNEDMEEAIIEKQLVVIMDKNGKEKKIKLMDYEASKNSQKVENEKIEGFPTIRFKIDGKTIDYPRNKKRTAEDVYNYIINEEYLQENKEENQDNKNGGMYKQCGGGNDGFSLVSDYYKLKYYKYKYKYMKLKKN